MATQDDSTVTASNGSYSSIAAEILRQKLESVVAEMPPAVELWKEDPGHIHRLRVATRRASAALKAFAALLPDKRARRLRRELSKLRRAVGEARDLDVLTARLKKRPGKLARKTYRKGLTIVSRRRCKAQSTCVAARDRLASINFTGRIDAVVSRVRWRSHQAEPSFHDVADRLLEHAAIDFRAATYMDVASIDAIHQLRIEAKQFRYTLDLFVSDGRRLRSVAREVKALQNRLGDLNDCDAALERFVTWARKSKSRKKRRLLKKLAKDQKRLLNKRTREFHQWWPDAQCRLRAMLDELRDVAQRTSQP